MDRWISKAKSDMFFVKYELKHINHTAKYYISKGCIIRNIVHIGPSLYRIQIYILGILRKYNNYFLITFSNMMFVDNHVHRSLPI